MGVRLFVGNLNHRTTEKQLERFFSSWGTVASVRIPKDRQTGRSRGFGFVDFPSEELADLALAVFNGRELGGRILRLNRPPDSQNGGAPSERPAPVFDGEATEVWSRSLRDSEDAAVMPEPDSFDDYARARRVRRHKGGKHGSDRKRSRGTRRAFD
jgi:cold-inducible RNA-binding protein